MWTETKILTASEREKKWQSLNLSDDFLFCKIMSDTALCAEMIHRIFPFLDVNDIKEVEAQKAEKLALHIRGVRFDIFTRVAQAVMDEETAYLQLSELLH